MPIKTRLTRSWGGETFCWLSTAHTCPTISPAVRLRLIPSSAVRQNWQSTAQPTWLETQIVARSQRRATPSICVPTSLPSPASPPSPSGIHTVSTVCPSPQATRYRTVPSLDTNFFSMPGRPTANPLSVKPRRKSWGRVEICSAVSTLWRYSASKSWRARYEGCPNSSTRAANSGS